MIFDEKLAKSAEGVAISNAKQARLEHSKDLSGFGENLAYNCERDGKIPSIKESIKQWYNLFGNIWHVGHVSLWRG